MAGNTDEGSRAPIVAELGRPETPSETAARKSAATRRHRQNQTALNLVIALIASLAIVLIAVLIVVRPTPPDAEPVDYAGIAAQVQPDHEAQILAPSLPKQWRSNSARIQTGADGVAVWYVGFLTPGNGFIGMTQGIDANATWLAAKLQGAKSSGSIEIDGLQWTLYDQRSKEDVGNLEFVMTTTAGESTLVLAGTADDGQFSVLATAIAAQIEGNE